MGFNSGVYRYDASAQSLATIVDPFVTPAPGGDTFLGASDVDINQAGDIVFGGIIPTPEGISSGLGMGVFKATANGRITEIVVPGDLAPGGGMFDFADTPAINDTGDIAFGAHVRGEECVDFGVPQSVTIRCGESLYLKRSGSDTLVPIVHQGDPAPGGGVFRYASGPVISNRGDVVFNGDITPAPSTRLDLGVFLYSAGTLTPIAGPGDSMPGGGSFTSPALQPGNWSIDDAGDVAFSATLDTDTLDTGLYIWSRGTLQVVARTGSELPGLGTLFELQPPSLIGWLRPYSGAQLNNRGKMLFSATILGDDRFRCVLLVASTGLSTESTASSN